MKNKFGFIPIILPVLLVMVLIIGMISMGGAQVQAQTPTATAIPTPVPTPNPTSTTITFLTLDEAGEPADLLALADDSWITEDPSKRLLAISSTSTVRQLEQKLDLTSPRDDVLDNIQVLVEARYIRVRAEEHLPTPTPDHPEVTINGIRVPTGTHEDEGIQYLLKEGFNRFNIVVLDNNGHETTHTIQVWRVPRDTPKFHSRALDGSRQVYKVDVEIPSDTNSDNIDDVLEIMLPYATGGNGKLTYTLRGVESRSETCDQVVCLSADAPSGMDLIDDDDPNFNAFGYDRPDGTAEPPEDGKWGSSKTSPNAPRLEDRSDEAEYRMRFTVEDSDGDTDTLEFTLVIVRFVSQLPGDPPEAPAPDPSQLALIQVEYDGISEGEEGRQTPELSPEFMSDVTSYTVIVPTDIEEVDIKAWAWAAQDEEDAASVDNNGAIDSSPESDTVPNVSGSYNRHEWTGLEVRRQERHSPSPINNIYTISVTGSDDETTVYEVNVRREIDIAPEFTEAGPVVLKYFAGVELELPNAQGAVSAGNLPAYELPKVEEDSGNGDLDTWTYQIVRDDDKGDLPTNPPKNFLGLLIRPGKGTADSPPDPNESMGGNNVGETDPTDSPTLTGTPSLDGGSGTTLPARRSRVFAELIVNDSDQNMETDTVEQPRTTYFRDVDEVDIEIQVWRDVSLKEVTIDGGTPRTNLGPNAHVFQDDMRFEYTEPGLEYSFQVPYGAETVTVAVTPNAEDYNAATNPDGADWAIVSHDDADEEETGHQVALEGEDNLVTIEVYNGSVTATHVINLERPGLRADNITLTVEEDLRSRPDKSAVGDEVVLTPEFDSSVDTYAATVEWYISKVRVAADPSPLANSQVLVNDIRVDKENGEVYSLDPGQNPIRIELRLDGAKTNYVVNVNRKSGSAPSFDGAVVVENAYLVGKSLEIELPSASGGDGMLSYSVEGSTLTEYGLMYEDAVKADANTVPVTEAENAKITGTPKLPYGDSQTLELSYVVTDADDEEAGDTDKRDFRVYITNDPDEVSVPSGPDGSEFPEGQGPDTLAEIIVNYTQGGVAGKTATLEPSFNPQNNGPYNVLVPHDHEDAQVIARPSARDAGITLNNLAVASGVKVNLPPNARIVVTSPDGSSTRTYTLSIKATDDTVPSFGEAAVRDMELATGVDMEPVTLPEGSGGNGELSYTLEDRLGVLPSGLTFDAESRELSGRPVKLGTAASITYKMTYQVTDENEDESVAPIEFKITICDPAVVPTCGISTDATLSALSLSGAELSPEFDSGTTEYSAVVEYSVESVTVSATATDEAATVSSGTGEANLSVGDTVIEVTATAEDESSMTYSVTVTRSLPEMLDVVRDSADMTMATAYWTPDMDADGNAAAGQWFFTVAKKAGDAMSGVDGLDLGTFEYEPMLAGDASTLELSGLMADRDYVYGVLAEFADGSYGMWETFNYTP